MDKLKQDVIDTIPDKYIGKRFDLFLSEILTEYSRSQIKKYIEHEYILIDGKPFKASKIISGNERVNVKIPPPSTTEIIPENMALDILYEDVDIVAVNKPAGLVVHPGAGINRGTLVNALMFEIDDLSGVGGEIRPGIVHRLDKDTSGVIVVAKNDSAHRSLSEQFKKREVTKEYFAIVIGELKEDSGTFDKPVSRDPGNRVRMTTRMENGRQALTGWEVVKKYKGFTFVRAIPKTGRTHQIRVHFADAGFPILGDSVYGSSKSRYFGKVSLEKIINRQALHAGKLGITHPLTAEKMLFEAGLPGDIKSVLDYLEEKCL